MKLRRRRPPWLARATKAAALVGAQRRRLQPTTKAVELVCPNMRLLAAYCLMGTVAAPRGVPLSSSGPNINAAAMGDVQQPSRMSRWSKEVPSHVQDEEEEASKRQRVERPLPCAEGGGEAGPSADDSDSACEAQEEGEEEELEDEEVGEEEEEGDEEYSAGEEEEEDTGEESERDSDNEGGSDACDNESPVRLSRK